MTKEIDVVVKEDNSSALVSICNSGQPELSVRVRGDSDDLRDKLILEMVAIHQDMVSQRDELGARILDLKQHMLTAAESIQKMAPSSALHVDLADAMRSAALNAIYGKMSQITARREDQIRLDAINNLADRFAEAFRAGFTPMDEEAAAGIERLIRNHGHDNYHPLGIIKRMNRGDK